MPDPSGARTPDPSRIDAHLHVWDLAVRDQPWTRAVPSLRRSFGFDDVRAQLTASGVCGVVLVQTVTVAGETPELLALAQRQREILGVVGWVDLTAPDCADRIAELRAGPGGGRLVGVRHQVQAEPDPRWLLRADVARGLAKVAGAGLVYELVVTSAQLPAAVELVRRLPSSRFVLDHAGNPDISAGADSLWRGPMTALAELPNVDVKLSGLLTRAGEGPLSTQLRPYADTVLHLFGARRVMFGSDWPVSTLRAPYREVVAVTQALVADRAPGEQAAIFGETARRAYRLGRR